MNTTTTTPTETYLRNIVHEGDSLLVLVTRVNSTGTARWMHVIASVNDEPVDITVSVAAFLGHRTDKHGALYISGAGMDMRYALVSELSRALFDREYAILLSR